MPRKNWVFCRHIVKRLVSHGVLLLTASCFLFHAGLDAQVIQTRRILILNEENATYPGISIINQGIQAELNDSPYQLQLYAEYMDTSLFPDPAVQQELRDSYIRKYRSLNLDVIITVGPSPLKLMKEVHQKAFPGVPIVFCLPTPGVPGPPIDDAEFTGVENDVAPRETVGLALRLLPGTRNVVVVGGVAPIDREILANVKKQLMSYEGRVEISYLTDLAMPDLLERLRRLPRNTIILLTSIAEDAAGTSFKSNESSPLITGAANVPVFSLFDVHLNHGEVGGYLYSLREQGKVAGGLTLRLLRGEKVREIPRVKAVNTYMFDWRALKRWGLKESALPPGSTVINRQPTVWESYKWYIIGGVSLILVEALLIFGLLWQRRRRLALHHTLEQQTALLQSREELLKTFVKNVPAGVVMLDNNMRYLQVSDRWCADYSLESSHILGRSHYELFPDIPQRWKEMHRRVLSGETLRGEEPWERGSGVKWVRWELHPWRTSSGSIGGMLILAEDITQQKQMEDAISSMSRKLLEALEEERSRIGRELHDDVNQRLALIAIDLGLLQNDPSDILTRLEALRLQTIDLSRDVQSLSHELHSTKLRYLGVVPAVQAWCAEFADRQKIDIQFSSDVSTAVPLEVGFCLLRVLQEALSNAAKHGGAKQIEVRLTERSGEVHMIVSDSGSGFNTETAQQGKGIGLCSMQERVRLVHGVIVIDSKPWVGTTVHVRIPLNSEDTLHKAAG